MDISQKYASDRALGGRSREACDPLQVTSNAVHHAQLGRAGIAAALLHGHDCRADKCAFFEDVFALSKSTRIPGPSQEALFFTPTLSRLPSRPQRRLLVLRTALKIVQLQQRELDCRPLIGFQYFPSTVQVDDAFDPLNYRIWCLLRRPFFAAAVMARRAECAGECAQRGSCSRRDVVIR